VQYEDVDAIIAKEISTQPKAIIIISAKANMAGTMEAW